MKPEGLDSWIERNDQRKCRSITSPDEITRQSLRERIVELQKAKEDITYELNRLKSFADGVEINEPESSPSYQNQTE